MRKNDQWRKETDSTSSHEYDVLIQGEEASCGLCCCCMITALRGEGFPNSRIIESNLPADAYKKSSCDRAGWMPTALTGLAPNEYHSKGTEIRNLGIALKAWHIQNTCHSPGSLYTMPKALRSASHARPIIARIDWCNTFDVSKRAGHWVLVVGYNNGELIVLDPALGLIRNNNLEEYQGGQFSPYWLQVD